MKLVLSKEKRLYKLDNKNEMEPIIDEVVPSGAKNLEVTYNDNTKILKLDYITFKED